MLCILYISRLVNSRSQFRESFLLSLDVSEVRLDDTDIAELGLSILSRHGRLDNSLVTDLPVDTGVDLVLVSELESVNATEDFLGVAAGGGRVGEDKTDLLGRVDDEDGTDGHGLACRLKMLIIGTSTTYWRFFF